MKRLFDILASGLGLLLMSPPLLLMMFLVWLQDFHSPLYIAPRVGRGQHKFKMVKLRSMIVNADKSGIDSTAATDDRITPVGHFVRRFKLDEIMQLWNVLIGDMSLVGPRPNVKRETDLYTAEEKRLLEVKPGITDLASIVFSDEGDILSGSRDPDLDYAQLIRPWKSRLGLFYIDHRSFALDLRIILLTCMSLVSRKRALAGVARILRRLSATDELVNISLRRRALVPTPPPGANSPVESQAA